MYFLVRSDGSGTGIMFLNEVALGNEHHIKMDDWQLKSAPAGYDSIVAKGRTEPGQIQKLTVITNVIIITCWMHENSNIAVHRIILIIKEHIVIQLINVITKRQ